jgi:hypothetical protein
MRKEWQWPLVVVWTCLWKGHFIFVFFYLPVYSCVCRARSVPPIAASKIWIFQQVFLWLVFVKPARCPASKLLCERSCYRVKVAIWLLIPSRPGRTWRRSDSQSYSRSQISVSGVYFGRLWILPARFILLPWLGFSFAPVSVSPASFFSGVSFPPFFGAASGLSSFPRQWFAGSCCSDRCECRTDPASVLPGP